MIALAARPWTISTALAAGVWPRILPPQLVHASDMQGHSLIYVCLHSVADQPYLYGGDWSTALTADDIAQANLGGAIVYLAGCFGIGPIAVAFIDAGAAAVVGDRDSTWAGFIRPTGSNEVGRLFVRGLRRGWTVGQSYDSALARFRAAHLNSARHEALADTVVLIGNRNKTLEA